MLLLRNGASSGKSIVYLNGGSIFYDVDVFCYKRESKEKLFLTKNNGCNGIVGR